MKIEKFNENAFIKEYSFTEIDLKDLDNKKKEIKSKEEKLFPLLLQYLKMNPDSINDPDIIKEDEEDDLIQVVDFEFYLNKLFITIFDYNNDETQLEISNKYLPDLYIFLKDPLTYKEAKKFNL